MHLKNVTLHPERYPTREHYPFNLPVFHQTERVTFDAPVTLFVGENGTGKSTLLEAVARACGIHIWRYDEGARFEVNPYEGRFCNYLTVEWADGRVPGSYFGSAIFQHFCQMLDEWAASDPGQLKYFGGKSLVTQSHGQSLMSFFRARYQIKGLYLLDEPETALSPKSQLELLDILTQMSEAGHAQFIVATHSPILLACPGAAIYSFDSAPVKSVRYEQTTHYQIYANFLSDRSRYLRIRPMTKDENLVLRRGLRGDMHGRFGPYGGQFVPETLMPALAELEEAFNAALADQEFCAQLADLAAHYAGRPTPLYFARRLSEFCGGAKIYLKREDLAHTGAHKINNALGQGLLARRMGKTRVVAETGAGQHGVASAAVCAMLGLQCVVYMGTEDMRRQAPNVFRMKLLGAEVRPVDAGSATLKDAINEAIRDWVTNVCDTHYLLGSALGPHPYPTMVREFQSVIGREARAQILEAEKRLPDMLIACVGGGSNAIGLFDAFRDDDVAMLGVEAGGLGIASGQHAARFAEARPGVLQGTYTYVLQDADGQIRGTHSVSAGLDYAAVGPEHAYLRDSERAGYTYATDDEALDAFAKLSQLEGILPALESSHAVAEAIKRAREMKPGQIILVNLSGRGDKDLQTVMDSDGRFNAKAQ